MQLSEQENISGKVVMITGASGGIGRIFAQALASAGALVAVTGRSLDRLSETVRAIEENGGRAIALAFDVTQEDAVKTGVKQIEETLGPVDILVNNAAEGGPIGNAWDIEPTDWWHTLETNLRGPFLCAHAVLPNMVSRRTGMIINIVSHAGVYRWPLCSAYAVSKSALIKFSENLAAETKRHGVPVFAFHPGLLEVGMTKRLLAAETDPNSPPGLVAKWFRRQISKGGSVSPGKTTATLLLLASGNYNGLSGCYLTVEDDLDGLVACTNGNDVPDLHTLRLMS